MFFSLRNFRGIKISYLIPNRLSIIFTNQSCLPGNFGKHNSGELVLLEHF